MNKKGFTLVEILAVLVIMGVLLSVAVPNVLKIAENMKINYFCEKVTTIEKNAILYAEDNFSDQIVAGSQETIIENINLTTLLNGSYLKPDVENCDYSQASTACLKDPRDDRIMDQDQVQIYSKNKRLYARYLYSDSDADNKICGDDKVYKKKN